MGIKNNLKIKAMFSMKFAILLIVDNSKVFFNNLVRRKIHFEDKQINFDSKILAQTLSKSSELTLRATGI